MTNYLFLVFSKSDDQWIENPTKSQGKLIKDLINDLNKIEGLHARLMDDNAKGELRHGVYAGPIHLELESIEIIEKLLTTLNLYFQKDRFLVMHIWWNSSHIKTVLVADVVASDLTSEKIKATKYMLEDIFNGMRRPKNQLAIFEGKRFSDERKHERVRRERLRYKKGLEAPSNLREPLPSERPSWGRPSLGYEEIEGIGAQKSQELIDIISADMPDRWTSADPTQAAATERYTHIRFYYDRYGQKSDELHDGEILREGQKYQMEVAIWEEFPCSERMRTLKIHGQTKPVEILVTVDGLGYFDVPETVGSIILPVRGNSTEDALFEVCPTKESFNKEGLAHLRVRLYYEGNLLDVVTVDAEVGSKKCDASKSLLGLKKTLAFKSESQLKLEADELEKIKPRIMHIDVTKANDNILLSFFFNSGKGQGMVFPNVSTHMSEKELVIILDDLRKALHHISDSSTFSEGVRGDGPEFHFSSTS